MLDSIKSLVSNLSVIVIIGVIVDIIMPKSSYRKYSKFVFGLILVLVILKPILNIVSSGEDLSNLVLLDGVRIEESLLVKQTEHYKMDQDKQIDKIYKQNLEASIASNLNAAFNLKNTEVNLSFYNDDDRQSSKRIYSIDILTEKQNNTESIEPIIIDLQGQSKSVASLFNDKEIKSIKNFLRELYDIDNELISINFR
ncbi:MAG: stage III sporulation protein AF [Clostridiales bacterium]|jgi:stage III sporulation protein AF|nr:stage III sporulation protein AF [Bacillota bacterium]NLH59055.1 stage III sporulation protein AF [Clostridiales bacterium]